MNTEPMDAFLYRYRRRPDDTFAEALYQRLSPRSLVEIGPSFAPLRQMAQCLTLMGFTLAVLFAISPDAKARLWKQILFTSHASREEG